MQLKNFAFSLSNFTYIYGIAKLRGNLCEMSDAQFVRERAACESF